jgi:hypothetical protein
VPSSRESDGISCALRVEFFTERSDVWPFSLAILFCGVPDYIKVTVNLPIPSIGRDHFLFAEHSRQAAYKNGSYGYQDI